MNLFCPKPGGSGFGNRKFRFCSVRRPYRRLCRWRRHASPRRRPHRRLSSPRRCTGQLHFGFVVLLPRAASGAKQTLAPPLTAPAIPSPSRRRSSSPSPPRATPPHPAPPPPHPELGRALSRLNRPLLRWLTAVVHHRRPPSSMTPPLRPSPTPIRPTPR